jgi:hypothetical protein
MKRALLAAALALSTGAASAADRDLSLAEAIDRALGKNQEIAVQREAETVAVANLLRADGSYDPEFRLDFRWQEQTEAVNFIFSGAPPGSVGPTSNGVLGQAAITEFLPTGGTVSLGTTIGRDDRRWLVSALGFELEMELSPLMVFFRYDDVPGVIGRVGTLFGDAGVNIANMAVSRTRRGGKALMALSLDGEPPPELVEAVREQGFDDARVIRLGAASG